MSMRRVVAIGLRVIRQILRDRRTVVLVFLVPLLILSLSAVLFRGDPPAATVGVVMADQGVPMPAPSGVGGVGGAEAGSVVFGELVTERLVVTGGVEVVRLGQTGGDDLEVHLRDGLVHALVRFEEGFSRDVQAGRGAAIDLWLHGIDPARNAMITALVNRAAVEGLVLARAVGGGARDGPLAAPIQVHTSYYYAGPDFDALDFAAPAYISFIGLFFVFLLTCVSFLRERVQGTLERVLATPATRLDVMLGYVVGLGLFAQVQVAVVLVFSVRVLNIRHAGSLPLLFLIVALLALVGLSLGILASAFARNELQAVQFIPLLIIPQALLSGTVWPVEALPGHLSYVAQALPLTYANEALRDVMLKGAGLQDVWRNLAVLVGFFGLFIALSLTAAKREGR